VKTYQDLFNQTLSKIRMVTNATGNKPLGDALVKIMFDFSDALKDKDLLKGDLDNDKQKKTE
jgi:hypothetical protein